MKRHLNTLFVTTQGAYLSKDGQTVLVRVEKETRLRIPIHNLGGIVCFGNVSCSPFLLGLCARHGIGVSFLTENGKFLARVLGSTQGNVLLRREQYRRADDLGHSAETATTLIAAKIANARAVLVRAVRERDDLKEKEALTEAAVALRQHLEQLRTRPDLETVRGIEGGAARSYFAAFNHLIRHQKDDFSFVRRSRRPPEDNVNALLSFLYTLVRHDVESALETTGLDPAVGFLHRDRPGRPGLALDLMEELRAPIADRLVFSLINRKQVTGKGFQRTETGGVIMNDDTRKEVLSAYQQRKQDEITHPFLEERMTLGLVFQIQARLFARYLRGDLDAYPPFIMTK